MDWKVNNHLMEQFIILAKDEKQIILQFRAAVKADADLNTLKQINIRLQEFALHKQAILKAMRESADDDKASKAASAPRKAKLAPVPLIPNES